MKRLRLPVRQYGSKDKRKQHRYYFRLEHARRIEDWINLQLTRMPRVFACFDIAVGIGADQEAVREILNDSDFG